MHTMISTSTTTTCCRSASRTTVPTTTVVQDVRRIRVTPPPPPPPRFGRFAVGLSLLVVVQMIIAKTSTIVVVPTMLMQPVEGFQRPIAVATVPSTTRRSCASIFGNGNNNVCRRFGGGSTICRATSSSSSSSSSSSDKEPIGSNTSNSNNPRNKDDDETWLSIEDEEFQQEKMDPKVKNLNRRDLLINTVAGGLLVASGVATWSLYQTELYTPPGMKRISPIQFIAALPPPIAEEEGGTSSSSSSSMTAASATTSTGSIGRDVYAKRGTNANEWGIWTQDPGPRGVLLQNYRRIRDENNGIAPSGWELQDSDFWLDEHGIVMETPSHPLQPGKYLVTGGRLVTSTLVVAEDGKSWYFEEANPTTTLYDVTHLPCRSARYRSIGVDGENDSANSDRNSDASANANANRAVAHGSPLTARQTDFPVLPGAGMPNVDGCTKQDYSVLLVVGKQVESSST